jgi:FtsH ternary system-associated peptide
MRVKVRFRFNALTGEVEAFEVDDTRDGPRLADHDARHERTATELAGLIEENALIDEVAPGAAPVITTVTRTAPQPEAPTAEPDRARE